MSSEKPGDLIRSWLFFAAMSLNVVLAYHTSGANILRQWRTADHDETQGTVGTSSVFEDRSDRNRVYGVTLNYKYTVNGQAYTGTQVGHGFRFKWRGEAEEFAKSFAPDSTVPVYYSPDDPSQAVLLRGLQGYTLLSLVWLYVLHMGWLWSCYLLFRHYRRSADGIEATVVAGRTHEPLYLGELEWMILSVGVVLAGGVLYLVESHPSLFVMGLFWAMVLAATGIVALRHKIHRKAG